MNSSWYISGFDSKRRHVETRVNSGSDLGTLSKSQAVYLRTGETNGDRIGGALKVIIELAGSYFAGPDSGDTLGRFRVASGIEVCVATRTVEIAYGDSFCVTALADVISAACSGAGAYGGHFVSYFHGESFHLYRFTVNAEHGPGLRSSRRLQHKSYRRAPA